MFYLKLLYWKLEVQNQDPRAETKMTTGSGSSRRLQGTMNSLSLPASGDCQRFVGCITLIFKARIFNYYSALPSRIYVHTEPKKRSSLCRRQ